MASPVLQFKRGSFDNLPGLRAGEPALTTDKFDLYVGIDSTTENNKFFGSHRYWEKETGSVALKLNLVDKDGSNSIALKAPDTLAGITTYTLPATASNSNGYFLQTDGDGVLSWQSVTGSATFNDATLSGITTISDAEIHSAEIQSGSINNTTIGLTTAAAGAFTTLAAESLNVSGIATAGSVSIGATQVISSAFELQNIASLDATTTATIEAAVANAPNTFDDLQVTGISTFNGEVNLGSDSADTITVKGTTTFEQPVVGTISTATALETAQDFSITGDFITASAVSFDGTSAVGLAATLALNSVELGTYTSGNYVATVAGTDNQISVFGSGSATAAVTISLPDDVVVGTSLSVSTLKTATIQHSNATEAITIDTLGNVGVSTNLTVSGNLYVNGSTTQINTNALTVEDRTIDLGIVNGESPATATTWDLGILFNYFTDAAKKSAVVWEHADTRFKFASVISADTNGTTVDTPQLTVTTFAPIEIGALWVTDCAGTSQVISCTGTTRNLENITIDAGEFA